MFALNFWMNSLLFFFFKDTATTEIYTLSLHDALPILDLVPGNRRRPVPAEAIDPGRGPRSEEHTSELQSRFDLVCRLRLEQKKNKGAAGGQPVPAPAACGPRARHHPL